MPGKVHVFRDWLARKKKRHPEAEEYKVPFKIAQHAPCGCAVGFTIVSTGWNAWEGSQWTRYYGLPYLVRRQEGRFVHTVCNRPVE